VVESRLALDRNRDLVGCTLAAKRTASEIRGSGLETLIDRRMD
jgi:hypothetical protein